MPIKTGTIYVGCALSFSSLSVALFLAISSGFDVESYIVFLAEFHNGLAALVIKSLMVFIL